MAECRKIVIVARGDTEADLELALEEALKRIRDGYLSGSDRNDEGGFYFQVATHVDPADWPR
ncbi:hypothetical protein [Accumulibacter sp.]|uniref:hypothetical protein n=1 Tax=Accumulibacter sp. TaxID=2053492 RepID=UPI0011DA71CD|nr:hypothetical protein [Accumulibacter sp.]TXG97635.1 MAG: hypothetical protein E6R09_12470 [Rhodocyclaceae bacterium]